MTSNDSVPAPLTPCIGVCQLDAAGYCLGCRRSLDEIAHWRDFDEAERHRLMRDVLPLRPPVAEVVS
ncbi:MAG TPA: DUF1289 domain-containing protein [Rhodanobacteraceae bacterium]